MLEVMINLRSSGGLPKGGAVSTAEPAVEPVCGRPLCSSAQPVLLCSPHPAPAVNQSAIAKEMWIPKESFIF